MIDQKMNEKLKVQKTHEHMNLVGFKNPTFDINDQALKEQELARFYELENKKNKINEEENENA